jgi:hypothetical protein
VLNDSSYEKPQEGPFLIVVSSGSWRSFANRSSCRLAASHLQRPKTFMYLDHLLSLVFAAYIFQLATPRN